ncbi:MarR family transcriptional regulator [Bradyrhizobium sp. dw_78]|uniref:MarR family winged helix-turn-helix transcriptional regulator n=1 Tax=Bradyrhizobium sp. dw_78 TaxID=2719793 RepID=UPI001BD557D1|nr:MarR family transcriptional regulator [Bradyrhizobium sp. dw_78]
MGSRPSPPANEDKLSLDSFLCFAIYSAEHAFNQFYRPLLDAIGLTYPQYLVMVALWADNDQTVKELGQKLLLDSSTLTPLLKRLETSGYLTRTRDPDDERQVRVRLTPAGRALKSRARGIPACVQDALGLSNDELKKIQADVLAIRDRLLSRRA